MQLLVGPWRHTPLRLRGRALAGLLLLLAIPLAACARPAGPVRQIGLYHQMRPTHKAVISSPVVHDWDGDGYGEIAIGSWDGFFYLLDHRLETLPGWPKFSPRGFFGSPALGDLDGDESPEIIVASDAGHLQAWHADGSSVPGFPIELGYKSWGSAVILPGPHIAIGGLRQLFLFDAHGRAVPAWPGWMSNWADSTPAVGADVIAITTLLEGPRSQGALWAWHLDGSPYPWSPLALRMDSDSSPALADLDDDGRVEIIVGDDEGLLHVVDLDGRELSGFPRRAQSLIEASPAIADLDGDGALDIAVGSWDGRMYLWDRYGRDLPGWPIRVGDQIISSAALVDLDGDDRLDIVVGSKDAYLYGWTATGKPLQGFPHDLGAHVFSSPWVGDLNANGQADVVVGANNGIHLLSDVGPLGRAAWPMFRRDSENTGAYR
ncbi:MAG: VCBS repeat-containing protein [Anaerolineae bacterium]|nr:VCBS repeat-containing protein [Anaerolineae bacterium]